MSEQTIATVHDALVEVARTTAFTPEALKQFDSALAEVKNLTSRVQRLEYDKKELENRNRVLDHKVSEFTRRETAIQDREEAVWKREAAMADLEKRTAVAEAKADVRKEVFDTIFRNTIVRENINRSVSETVNGPTYSSVTKSDNHASERHAE